MPIFNDGDDFPIEKPDDWPEHLPWPPGKTDSGKTTETIEYCPNDHRPKFKDDEPSDACHKLAEHVLNQCLAAGNDPKSCGAKSFGAYMACIIFTGGGQGGGSQP